MAGPAGPNLVLTPPVEGRSEKKSAFLPLLLAVGATFSELAQSAPSPYRTRFAVDGPVTLGILVPRLHRTTAGTGLSAMPVQGLNVNGFAYDGLSLSKQL